jgi:hypothetical protein
LSTSNNPLSKTELKKQMRRFYDDKDRGISIERFCELAGISLRMFHSVFVYEEEPLSEYIQMRVNKAYAHWKEGSVRVMRDKNQKRYVEYRRVPEPPIMRQMKLQVTPEGVKVKVGLVNRHDYSNPSFDEQLRG